MLTGPTFLPSSLTQASSTITAPRPSPVQPFTRTAPSSPAPRSMIIISIWSAARIFNAYLFNCLFFFHVFCLFLVVFLVLLDSTDIGAWVLVWVWFGHAGTASIILCFTLYFLIAWPSVCLFILMTHRFSAFGRMDLRFRFSHSRYLSFSALAS